MRRLATLAVVTALMSPMTASGQDYTFGDWARDQGYSPGDVMPEAVMARLAGIDSLDGVGEFDWTTTPTWKLYLARNQISSIEAGTFSGLSNLTQLSLWINRLTSLESDTFNGLTNLSTLDLTSNQLSSLAPGVFSDLTNLKTLYLSQNKLSNLAAGVFSELAKLRTLDLSTNRLSSLAADIFSDLTNLRTLYLRRNYDKDAEFSAFVFDEVVYQAGHVNPTVLLIKIDVDEKRLVGISVLHQHNGAVALADVQENHSNTDVAVLGPDYVTCYACHYCVGKSGDREKSCDRSETDGNPSKEQNTGNERAEKLVCT